MIPDEPLLTESEYAEWRKCSLRTLQRERAERRGCPYVSFNGQVRYRPSDVRAHAARNVVDVTAASQPRRRGRPPKVAGTPASEIDAAAMAGAAA